MKKSLWQNSYKQLSIELKRIRKAKGLTQVQLSELLQKPQSYVSKYESGERFLDFLEVIQICIACSYDPKELVDFILTIKEF